MFETAVTIADGHDEKPVFPHRCLCRFRLEQADLVLANFLQIRTQPRHIRAMPAGDGDVVRHATGFERRVREGAHLDGVVDQLIVIRGGKAAELLKGNS